MIKVAASSLVLRSCLCLCLVKQFYARSILGFVPSSQQLKSRHHLLRTSSHIAMHPCAFPGVSIHMTLLHCPPHELHFLVRLRKPHRSEANCKLPHSFQNLTCLTHAGAPPATSSQNIYACIGELPLRSVCVRTVSATSYDKQSALRVVQR